jgi:hypothetical protein
MSWVPDMNREERIAFAAYAALLKELGTPMRPKQNEERIAELSEVIDLAAAEGQRKRDAAR